MSRFQTGQTMLNKVRIILIIVLSFFALTQYAGTIYVKEFRPDNCASDSVRYMLINKIHHTAIKTKSSISYEGVKEISLRIPKHNKPIPLPSVVDFSNVTINICNQSNDTYLFTRKQPSTIITALDNPYCTNFNNVPELQSNLKLLIIEDTLACI